LILTTDQFFVSGSG